MKWEGSSIFAVDVGKKLGLLRKESLNRIREEINWQTCTHAAAYLVYGVNLLDLTDDSESSRHKRAQGG